MNIFQVTFIGRRLGSIGKFSRYHAILPAESIFKEHIIKALGRAFEVNAIIYRANLSQDQALELFCHPAYEPIFAWEDETRHIQEGLV